jgi:ankyrin repeat protein
LKVKSGKIKPDEKDGLGMCPLILAVDCGFGIKDLEQLIDLGCSPYTVDDNGDTLLHYAINLGNSEVEEWLLSKYRLRKDIQNNEGLTAYD